MRVIVLALLLLAPGAGLASQPISESLVECSAIYDHAGTLMADRRAEDSTRLKRAGDIFYAAAIDAATAERRPDPDRYAALRYDEKVQKWSGLTLIAMAAGSDFKDWTTYCRKLGAAKGLPAL